MRGFEFLPGRAERRRIAGRQAAHYLTLAVPRVRDLGLETEADALLDFIADVEEIARISRRAKVTHNGVPHSAPMRQRTFQWFNRLVAR